MTIMVRNDLRNIAIIAHVDHGKTTLVDEMLKQGGAFRENQNVAERVMDSNDLERERGITILAKNTSVCYNGIKINIIDTPGHADFGGEVERVLNMVDGVLLLVDAAEGPMPQTRFVLSKALEMGHKIIIVVNKIDRPDARLDEIGDEVLELLLELDANDEQLESPILFCSGRAGTASLSQYEEGEDLTPLFDTIVNYIEPPQGDENAPLQMLISSIDYNEYVGRIGIGRIERGTARVGQAITVGDYHESRKPYNAKLVTLMQIQELKRVPVETATVGDIVWVSGIENITIGDTVCENGAFEPLPFTKISEPTVEMTFSVNDSPLAGRDGKFVTSRQLRDRLFKELLKDVSLRVSETDSTDSFLVAGRGEMHLSILIENMRREGYELTISQPHVITKEIDGVLNEPIEILSADVPDNCTGKVIELVGCRKGEMLRMEQHGNRQLIEFHIPTRGIIGLRSKIMTATAGEAIISHRFDHYEPFKGDIPQRINGVLVSMGRGKAIAYAIDGLQLRGKFFIEPGVETYEGMIVGEHCKDDDLEVNLQRAKKLTNMRAAGSDRNLKIAPAEKMSLEEALEYIADDEYLEVTPQNIRLRKKYLTELERRRMRNAKAREEEGED